MPKIQFSYAMPSDWLKWDEDGWYSPENGILAANSGDLLSGTVLGKLTADGKMVPLDLAAAGTGAETAAGVLYLDQQDSAADLRIAYIKNHCVVADKALKFKGTVTPTQKTAAFQQLEAQGIKVREAV